MAKMFYSAKEAAQRLGKSEEDVKALVRAGTLREFRDAGSVNYKVDDVDALAARRSSAPEAPSSRSSASASGEVVLEPAEDSSIELAPSGSDVVSLEDVDKDDTAIGARPGKKAKEGTVVPSVGVNVFDDEELDEVVDPLAQTAVTDVAGLGMDGVGSGSGILDLTRESDDTSLGAELLEEIYTGEEEGGAAKVEMGEDTRAGLDEALPDEEAEAEAGFAAKAETRAGSRRVVTRVVEYGPDAVTSSLTALLVVAVLVMCFAGLAGAGLVRGITPGILAPVYANLWMYGIGAVVVSGIAAGVTYFLGKRAR